MTKKKTIFDLLTDVTYNKIPWEEQSEIDKKEYSTYMVNRFLSMNMEFIGLVNYIQEYNLSPRESYKVYLDVLPKKKAYSKYINSKGKKDMYHPDLISKLGEVNNWSEQETIENLFILEKNSEYNAIITDFLRKFGKSEQEISAILINAKSSTKKSK